MDLHISVRNLVEFVMRSGDIDSRHSGKMTDNAMAEGGRIHRLLQKKAGDGYEPEVSMNYVYQTEKYNIIVEGRADGVITKEGQVTIDEIKGTYRDLDRIKEPQGVHLAQAKCYAYFYADENALADIKVRMTYCNMDTEELKYFLEEYTFLELKEWFQDLMDEYQRWADFETQWKAVRQTSIKKLVFPFPYRAGQKELAADVYRTIYHKKKLFIEAPTGVGKTITTVFPAVKAIGEDKADRIFYLTAKTITRTVADDTFRILQNQGLKMKSITITAKEKICPMEEMECNPDVCSYAKGHYDRVNDAIYDLLTHEDSFNRDRLEEYAAKYKVCPFEMSLDMSLFSDAIICDYNYLFDPHVYLKRFFFDGNSQRYLFLIDEAHNLVDRGREMYSASLVKEDMLSLKNEIRHSYPANAKHLNIAEQADKIAKSIDRCNKEFLLLKRECEDSYCVYENQASLSALVMKLMHLYTQIEKYLEEEEHPGELRKKILDYYFVLAHFLLIWESVNEDYRIYAKHQTNGNFELRLFCVNPSGHLQLCMEKGVSSILFSATFLPIQYYKKLLGGEPTDYEVYAKSAFNPKKKGLFIANDVTTKYTRRNEEQYHRVAQYIKEITQKRHGNYLVFFPSHAFAQKVFYCFKAAFEEVSDTECILQSEYMSENAREEFLGRFQGNPNFSFDHMFGMDVEVEDEKSLIAFCVMGGIFSEGIDLKGDSLIGAIVVGNGLPQICVEREILKSYFDENGQNGFDFAYRFPGMNKVLQSAGRVIRTAQDVGIVVLLDERFLENTYRKMFPREWEKFELVNVSTVSHKVEQFWNEWL